ncbi:uncharacterized protein LOC113004452 isoform X2 [Solenopsis invicta]|uniref:uncharacterized protein LOC113004452 isoform X2 n=1 Tax=Solenopsis invicta TaxID=13686 RepID=UPI00193C97E0|nr:uncharacterized protein LOC113004452 isoform X2 [Solenopsis invicta]XP_039312258.1 uncharacterized protein LOC113004452 isoform X2 [Solenopsis invicta]XP_039312259.1 uncharacterized protein LOC113004452 isoform X2 [Solenopsis invicta]
MDNVSQLLHTWGVTDVVIETFKENRIRMDHLTKMTELTMEKLIPIAGERLDFMEHLKKYKEYMQKVARPCSKSISKDSSVPIVDIVLPVSEDITYPVIEVFDNTLPSTQDKSNLSSCEKNNSYDLFAILKSSTCGKMILAYHNTHACLNNNMRNSLASEIINYDLNNNINARMQNERVEFLAKEVVKHFPSEVETIWKGAYFGKSRRESSVGRGLLLQKYYSTRRKLRKCGVLTKESVHAIKDSSASTSEMQLDENIPQMDTTGMQWLKNNSKPWSKVQELWTVTNNTRMWYLQKDAIAVHEYMDMFPAVKHANGYLLLEQDFNKMYPNSTMKLYTDWPLFAAFIEKKIKNKKEIEDINNSLTPDGKKVRTLLALNLLFTVLTTLKRKKEQWRPSRQESREAFLLLVKSTNDIQPTLNLRRQKYAKYGLTLGVQAVIVEYKRMMYFQSTDAYIPPESYYIDSHVEKKRT